jgi:hypothetical protein
MAQSETRSLEQMKRETEQTRANLTETVEQLRSSVSETATDIRQRVSTDAIKAEVSHYLRSRGEQLLHDLTDAARRNPMQAVAVGTGVAYPLLRLARAIPLPVWMAGAGLFLASSKTGQEATQKATEAASDLANVVMHRARDLGNQAAEAASAAKSLASENIDRLSEAVSGATLASRSERLQGTAASLAASAADRAADIREQGASAVRSAAANVQDIASSAASAGSSAVDATKEAGLQAAKTVRETTSDLGERAGKTFLETVEQNPLLVAGVGLVVGGLIASAFPRSDIEEKVIRAANTSVKRRADAAAARAVHAAKDAVDRGYDEAARQAQAEGLTPDGLGEAARDIGERLRHVAEAAVTTAFEPPENGKDHQRSGDNHQQRSTQGETDHG